MWIRQSLLLIEHPVVNRLLRALSRRIGLRLWGDTMPWFRPGLTSLPSLRRFPAPRDVHAQGLLSFGYTQREARWHPRYNTRRIRLRGPVAVPLHKSGLFDAPRTYRKSDLTLGTEPGRGETVGS